MEILESGMECPVDEGGMKMSLCTFTQSDCFDPWFLNKPIKYVRLVTALI